MDGFAATQGSTEWRPGDRAIGSQTDASGRHEARKHFAISAARAERGALDDLLRVIAQRNSELTEANLSLEARVAARTAELETTNHRLEGTIEALRSTQVKLVETEKLASVGQLASGLAHEINNPLAFISSNLSALGEHADTLMQVDALAQSFEPALPAAARADLHRARGEADLAFAREDLLSLVINATQAVHDRADHRGEVTVRTGVEGNHVFAEVTDNGVGMEPEVLARAFEPFFTTRPPGQGVGLGLSTAWNCAQAHGGKVEAKSQEGVGSTFRLLLAVDGHPASSSGPSFTNPFNTRRYGNT